MSYMVIMIIIMTVTMSIG